MPSTITTLKSTKSYTRKEGTIQTDVPSSLPSSSLTNIQTTLLSRRCTVEGMKLLHTPSHIHPTKNTGVKLPSNSGQRRWQEFDLSLSDLPTSRTTALWESVLLISE